MSTPATSALARRLGLTDAVVIGLAAMIGAGVFTALAPAARAAGTWLLAALGIAAVVAGANALSSARLAARYPESGGTYVYGRERLSPFWGYLAGWVFVAGKTSSCAAMALTIGVYLWPAAASEVAVGVVLLVLALNLLGIHRSAGAARVIIAIVLIALAAFLLMMVVSPPPHVPADPMPGGLTGAIQGAGFLFFAFAGYARIATLGEEVRDPERTIPRAIGITVAIVLALYLAIAVTFLTTMGVTWLAGRDAPIADAADLSGWPWLGPPLRAAAALAAGGALLALVLGVSRTTLAMARDGHLPHGLARVDGTRQVPIRAEIAVAGAVIAALLFVDLQAAIGFSSFCVLVYYAVANASAWTLDSSLRHRLVPAIGFFGCLVVALLLPWRSVVTGLIVLGLGALAWVIRKVLAHDDEPPLIGPSPDG
ncbi:APC family permease [Janibacter sp. GXQ6167]|uniref:APC family permease n=1 Tax=Janibacter sp. GXQ6167 TaxID=3240791 RepID=UPI003525B6D2